MWQPFLGGEAIRDGTLTRGKLRWNYDAVHPGVYLPSGVERTVSMNAVAAWLWTRRRGVIAGRALHGARWVDASTPIEVIAEHTRPRAGIIVREERIADDEITEVCGLPVTSLGRTALDLARHLDRNEAVARLDALGAATGVKAVEALALADRYRGARGLRRARDALALMDAGAQSPRETWLRLLLIDAGLPPPRTQIRVSDGVREAFIDWGSPRLRGRDTTSPWSVSTTRECTTAPNGSNTCMTSAGLSSSIVRAGSTSRWSRSTVGHSFCIVYERPSLGAAGHRRRRKLPGGGDQRQPWCRSRR
jgi:hypothetical protein